MEERYLCDECKQKEIQEKQHVGIPIGALCNEGISSEIAGITVVASKKAMDTLIDFLRRAA